MFLLRTVSWRMAILGGVLLTTTRGSWLRFRNLFSSSESSKDESGYRASRCHSVPGGAASTSDEPFIFWGFGTGLLGWLMFLGFAQIEGRRWVAEEKKKKQVESLTSRYDIVH